MKECKIVQDLLPSYIEKLTSKDTNEYIEGHLKTCENCTSVYHDMKAEIKVNTTSPKAEIDYMKKVRKKMRIAEKLLYIILLLFIIFVLVFWREIFSFICYTDICNRYLKYQEEVFETQQYTVYSKNNTERIQTCYTPTRTIEQYKEITSDETRVIGYILNSNIENTQILFQAGYNDAGEQIFPTTLTYLPKYDEATLKPYYPVFSLDKKATFWDLMSTFSEIRNIRIVEGRYELDLKDFNRRFYLFRGDRFEVTLEDETKTLKVGQVPEDMNMVDFENGNMYFFDYEMPNRKSGSEKIEKKISDCDQEAGTVVNYDFEITKDDKNLVGLKEDNNNKNLLMAKITNNITYKEFQKKWSGLRDMTDEDFINYSAIIVVDKDTSKKIQYKSIGDSEISPYETAIKITEEDKSDSETYSAILIIVPNTMDKEQTHYHISYYNAEIVNN